MARCCVVPATVLQYGNMEWQTCIIRLGAVFCISNRQGGLHEDVATAVQAVSACTTVPCSTQGRCVANLGQAVYGVRHACITGYVELRAAAQPGLT